MADRTSSTAKPAAPKAAPTKAEHVASEHVASEQTAAEPARAEQAKIAEPAKTEPARTAEPAKIAEPAKAEPAKIAEPAKVEQAKTAEPAKAEPAKIAEPAAKTPPQDGANEAAPSGSDRSDAGEQRGTSPTPDAEPEVTPGVTESKTVTVDDDGVTVRDSTHIVKGDGSETLIEHTHQVADGKVTETHRLTEQDGAVTTTSEVGGSVGADGVGASAGHRVSVHDATVVDVGVEGAAGHTGASAGAHATGSDGKMHAVEAEVHNEATSAGVSGKVQHGDVTQEAAAVAERDADSVDASIGARTTVDDTVVSGVEARAHADAERVSGGVYQEDATGVTNFAEAEIHHDETSTGARVAGRVETANAGTQGSASYEVSGNADGTQTAAETDVRGSADVGDAGVRGEYHRTTTTDGDDSSDTTTVGGGAHLGDRAVSAERTVSNEQTATTETDTTHTEAEVSSGDASAGVAHTHREHVFDTDEDETDAEALLGFALGNGERPEDHETTTTVEGHVRDHEASVTATEGSDLDGTRGEGWTGHELGADYTESEWSSKEVRLDEHVLAHERETTDTVDHNPLDGDLEDSSAYRESVRVDGFEAEVRTESVDRKDINPFDGDVSQETSSYQGVTVDGTEVSKSQYDRVETDLDLTDGDVGRTSESGGRTVVGDNEWTNSSSESTSVGTDGIDRETSSEFANRVGGVETGGEQSTRVHADLGGVEYEESSSSYGPIGSNETTRTTKIDTDVTDGDVGMSGRATSHDQFGDIGEVDQSSSGRTTVGTGGVTHESSNSADVRVGDIEAGIDQKGGFEADLGGSSSAGRIAAEIDDVASVESTTSHQTDTDPFDGSVGARGETRLDAEILGVTGGADAHAGVQFGDRGYVDVGTSAGVDGLADAEADFDAGNGQVSGGAQVTVGDGTAHAGGRAGGGSIEAEAGLANADGTVIGGSTEIHNDGESIGTSSTGTFLGVTVTGSASTSAGVHVGVDNDGDGHDDTAGEIVDDTLEGIGDGIEDAGDAVGDALEGLGDGIEDAGEAIGDFLSGGDDDDDDDDDSIGDVIDNFLSGWA